MTGPARRLMRIYILNQTLHWFMIGVVIPVSTLFRLEARWLVPEVATIRQASWVGAGVLTLSSVLFPFVKDGEAESPAAGD